MHVGSFDTESEAAAAYNAAVKKTRPDALLNDLDPRPPTSITSTVASGTNSSSSSRSDARQELQPPSVTGTRRKATCIGANGNPLWSTQIRSQGVSSRSPGGTDRTSSVSTALPVLVTWRDAD